MVITSVSNNYNSLMSIKIVGMVHMPYNPKHPEAKDPNLTLPWT